MSKLFKNTIAYLLIGFLPVAANFLLAPIYTRFLSPDQYALVGIATLFQTFLSFFLSLSLDVAFSRLYFDYEKKLKLKYALLSTLLLAVVIISIFIFILLFFIGDDLFAMLLNNRVFRFSNFGYWVVITTFSNVIFLFFALLYRNEERIKKFIFWNMTFFFIPVAGTLAGLIILREGAMGAIAGRAIGSVLVIGLLLFHYFIFNVKVIKLNYLRRAIKYSFPLIPYGLMFAAFSNIDRIFLERSFSTHDFGVYNFAIMITGLIPIFLNALTNAISPTIYRELTNTKDHSKIRTFNYLTIFVTTGIICICVACVVPAMELFINHEYADAYPYIGTLFLSFLPYLHYLIYTLPLSYYGKTKAFPVISFFALLGGIFFNYLFIPFLGIWAVCLSLYVIRAIQLLVAYLYAILNKFHVFYYLIQTKAIVGSVLIVIVYNVLLILHYLFRIIPIEIINLVPVVVFILLSIFIYNKEVKAIYLQFLGLREVH